MDKIIKYGYNWNVIEAWGASRSILGYPFKVPGFVHEGPIPPFMKQDHNGLLRYTAVSLEQIRDWFWV